ncbi:AP-3 complex subunit beta-2 isoform X2 [Cimex lectularius]|uniref:AP-3 complex subunit beta n=1 Tax=Cimex lectularius TaxID=79782 RepID=A0A8I6SSI3_CIMLE|nr:AP-3 complex subunit beta-2 isoform X2 [Cimex lectularius]
MDAMLHKQTIIALSLSRSPNLTIMANNGSYSNDRPAGAGDIDYGSDPASGGFFFSDSKKHHDLKQMLDTNKDGLKLEAMKRIIGMVARGRDASELFPAVVKNVVSKNIEVKKLVYVYLVRYAEEQQDLALLSISTFQRALKDPNQLIRASALRVLSSIRVPVIVPIVLLAIKDSAMDMSPYVRKTAAHAIPKLFSLDPEQKEELVIVIEKLLSDKTTLVVGSAVMAFEEVCPEKICLIHKNYRKLCNLLVDVDEWGQVIIINMLTRYARTQFVDPNKDININEKEVERPFYDDDVDNEDVKNNKPTFVADPDYRLLLKNAKPLLQSRNASVVMAVAQLFHHLAPRTEVSVIAKSLVRLLRSYREVQSIVLNCIASISIQRKGMFEPYLKSFFVRTSDPTHIKLLKLEILTNLATETSISVILREFQTYISSPDKEFVAAAIQAIGRCASNIKEVTDCCLNGLVTMLSNRDEAVVAESVVVIKKLLQSQPSRHRDIIRSMAKLMDTITVPAARASILWLLGEYSELVPTIAPDVLRKMAKSFINEEDIVKLQVLNLAIKLFLTNPEQTKLLCQYVFSLARYDQNYDIRDRSRFLRQFIFPTNTENNLSSYSSKFFLASKPAPLLQSKFKDRENYQMGSLTHYINMRAAGYHDLPDFPDTAPDPAPRNVAEPIQPSPPPLDVPRNKKQSKSKSFYSDSDSSQVDEDSDSSAESDEDDDDDDDDNKDSSSDDSSDGDSESDSSESSPQPIKNLKNQEPVQFSNNNGESESESDSSEMSSSDDSDSDSSDDEMKTKLTSNVSNNVETKGKSNLDLLLDLDDVVPNIPVLTPSFGGFLSPLAPAPTSVNINSVQPVGPTVIPSKRYELLNKITGRGLSIEGRFTRQPHLFSGKMVSIELKFNNNTTETLEDIKVSSTNLSPGMQMHKFAPINTLPPQAVSIGTIGVDWNDSTQPVSFEVSWNDGKAHISLKPPIGELIRSVRISHKMFLDEQAKLKGMNEHQEKVPTTKEISNISNEVCKVANMSLLPSVEPDIYRFAGETMASKSLILASLKVIPNSIQITVNCEKLVVGSMLLTELKSLVLSHQ